MGLSLDPAHRPKSWLDKLAYGLGSVAFGAKDAGFQFLLLLFYNQALGLRSSLVGLAILIAVVLDSVCDPLVGAYSDRLRSRWGRRHPLMYASAIPLAVSFFFLWNPPTGLGETGLFAYLLAMVILVRTTLTLYDIPSSAMVVDLTDDYDERTVLLAYRNFFGTIGFVILGIAGFSVFLKPSPQYPVGQLNLDGYAAFGLTASLLMLITILISAAGTHRYIPTFRSVLQPEPFELARFLKEIVDTLSFRPLLIAAGAAIFSQAAFGVVISMSTYFRIYFWEIPGDKIGALVLATAVAAFVGLLVAPHVAARVGKRRAAILFLLIAILTNPLVYIGRLADVLPANGKPMLLTVLFLSAFLGSLLTMATYVAESSMLADVVEAYEVHSGRFSAGLVFSAHAFILKVLSGFGVFASGLILDFVDFPEHAVVGQVPQGVLERMALTEIPVVAGLELVALLFVWAYPISRASHERNVAAVHASV